MSGRPEPDDGETEELDAVAVPADAVPADAVPADAVPADAVPGGGRSPGQLPQVSSPRPIAPGAAPARQLVDLRSAPALQAAAVAAGGFVAGAAVVGLARRRRFGPAIGGARTRRAHGRRGSRRGRRRHELTQVVASRSFLVDVHLLGPADRGR